jgi:hypothetical protein
VLSRQFWKRTIASSLGDVADLVAPATLVLCEGRPSTGTRAEFDARILRTIFQNHVPDADFLAIGGDRQVIDDQLGVGRAVEAVTPGATVIRLIDKDDRSPAEIEVLAGEGVRVLSRRNVEGYLLDEEVLAHDSAVEGGKPADDWKAAKGDIYNGCKRILGLQQAGSNADVFLAEQLAPLITPGMQVYEELRDDVFG